LNNNAIEILEFNKIKENLKGYALSDMAKDMFDKLQPQVDINVIERWLQETSEARAITNSGSSVPLHSLANINFAKDKLAKGMNLMPEELEAICGMLRDGKKLKSLWWEKSLKRHL
jgi:Mismatch repair ATPase (MutS family)